MMKRRTSLLATLLFLSVTLPLTFAQNLKSEPSPVLPSDILGPQLIAWSQVQKPQPVPQPLPPPDRAAQSAQPTDQQPVQSANALAPPQPPAAQTFTGTIVKDGSTYVLRVSGESVYHLDDQERAKQYEGKQVKIAGTLDANGNSLHITSIELLS
jgi:hypothetical protein